MTESISEIARRNRNRTLAVAIIATFSSSLLIVSDSPLSTMRLDAGLSNLDTAGQLIFAAGFSIISVYAGFELANFKAKLFALLQMLGLTLVLYLIISKSSLSISSSAFSFQLCAWSSAIGLTIGSLLSLSSELEKTCQSKDNELRLLRQENIETRIQLLKDDELERRMLACDLHDQVLNDLEFLRRKIAADDVSSQDIDNIISECMSGIREVMDSLSPSIIDHIGLGGAIEDLLRRSAKDASIKSKFNCRAERDIFERLDKIEQTLLYRIAQEAVRNACKHANATIIKVAISEDATHLHIEIIDDGRGFNAGSPPVSSQRHAHGSTNDSISEKASPLPISTSRGLRYMRQRAGIIGADINWRTRGPTSEEGSGTIVTVSMPKRQDYSDA